MGTVVGLTMKKNQVYIIPQALHLTQTKREYQLQIEREMEQHELDNYVEGGKRSTRRLTKYVA